MTLYHNRLNHPCAPQDMASDGQMQGLLSGQAQAARRAQDTDLSKIEWCQRNFDHCKNIFAQCCIAVCPDFQFRPDRAQLYRDLVAWACRLPQSPYDTRKGLYIGGNIGVGKSTLLRVLARFLPMVRPHDAGRPCGLGIRSCRDVCALYQSEGLDGLSVLVSTPRQAFDELGAEPIPTGYYGTPLNVMAHVLDIRYDNFVDRGDITIVTTNLMFSQIAAYYGERIADRCTSMFSVVEMLGSSLRR